MPRQPLASILSITVLCIVAQLTDCTIDEPRLGWHRHKARLSQLFVAGRNAEQTLSGLLEHKYRLSAVQAQRSLVYQGHNARLRTLLHHFDRKKSIRITVVGGGPSCGVEYAAMCKSSVLAQPQLDLVLLELNQQAIHPTDVKVAEPLVQYEQLIRVALNTSPPPAVVMLQVRSHSC
ncbi:SGNH hydrolase [Haematococcus lacustris]|uniref:SGNH hydrolase n=1 Tax=Haematococcus lacustris TaxID=44745 RepID=A0A699YQJ7_HAELA|nr:SGNH hydrolase [Haematococcus lacustris]